MVTATPFTRYATLRFAMVFLRLNAVSLQIVAIYISVLTLFSLLLLFSVLTFAHANKQGNK